MQGRSLLPLVLALAVAAVCLWGRGGGSAPPSPDAPAGGTDLVAAFRTNDDRAQAALHAHTFATICASLAECLEYDGTRPTPLIKTGVQVDELRRGVRQTRMKGWSFVTKYPELGPAVDAFLTQRVGTGGGPLAGDQRAHWVSALRQLAAAAEYAAGQG